MSRSYKSLISRDKKEVEKDQVDFKVEEAKQSLQADRLETKKQIAKKERELEEAKSAIPFDASKVVNIKQDLKGLKEGLGELDELEGELFPEE